MKATQNRNGDYGRKTILDQPFDERDSSPWIWLKCGCSSLQFKDMQRFCDKNLLQGFKQNEYSRLTVWRLETLPWKIVSYYY